MLRQSWRKRHLINLHPPSQKKWPFWGGVRFWNIFMNFWVWNTKKILVRLWGKADVLG